nr:peptidoglycan-binding domain-containing protein [Streptomyces sp. SID13726]
MEARTAEAAAAEDFDPVRIRPFVEVGEEPPEATGEPQPPMSGTDLSDFPAVPEPPAPAPDDELSEEGPRDDGPDRRKRRTVLLAGAGAAAAVLVTGGFVGGIFSYDGPSRDDSVAGGVRAGVPEEPPASSGSSSATPSPAATPTGPSASPTSSATAGPTDATASPSDTATPTGFPSSAAATATVAPGPSASGGEAPVLSLGDQGAEVVELQLRLKQVGFYDGDADGDFDREVESAVRTYQVTRFVLQDTSGVYGKATRTALESETSEP